MSNFNKIFFLTFLGLSLVVGKLQAQDNTTYFINPIYLPIEITDTIFSLKVESSQHNYDPYGYGFTNAYIDALVYNDAVNTWWAGTVMGPIVTLKKGKSTSITLINNFGKKVSTHFRGVELPIDAHHALNEGLTTGSSQTVNFEVKNNESSSTYFIEAQGTSDNTSKELGAEGTLRVLDDNNTLATPLPQTYAYDDWPLMFETKKFKTNAQGALEIDQDVSYTTGYEYLANELIEPYLIIVKNVNRFRLMNTDNKMTMNLGIGTRNMAPIVDNLGLTQPMHLIATDRGYTDKSYAKDEILVGPGERVDVLFDATNFGIGDTLFIYNKVSGIPADVMGSSASTQGYAQDKVLLKIIVGGSVSTFDNLTFPINLVPNAKPLMSDVSKTRLKKIRKDDLLVDGVIENITNFDNTVLDMMVINDIIKMDSTEVWTIENTTTEAQPFYLQHSEFWVTEIKENGTALVAADYPELFAGAQDNILIRAGWEVSFIAKFANYGSEISSDSTYYYRSAMIPTQNKGMIGQFVVWNQEGNPPVNTNNEELPAQTMTLFPNPNNTGVLYLKGNSDGQSLIRIMDVQGRIVREGLLPAMNGTGVIDIQGISKGFYFVEWRTEEGIATQKVIIE
jgi:FtsP/CotA-like multicopper oxidase with cupredoxin domain